MHSDCYVFVSFYLVFVYSIDFELNMRIMSIYFGCENKVNGKSILLRSEKIFNFQIKFICVFKAVFSIIGQEADKMYVFRPVYRGRNTQKTPVCPVIFKYRDGRI